MAHAASRASWRPGTRGAGYDATSEGAMLSNIVQEFEIMDLYGTVMMCNPFRFHCPLPLNSPTVLEGMDADAAEEACCHAYDRQPLLWPYQFPECRQSRCPTCWRQSEEADLARHPAAGLAALAYASALAVSGPRKMSQQHLGEHAARGRRLPAADKGADTVRDAKLPSRQIIAPLKYGLRTHDSNMCPNIEDWHEFYLNDDRANIHARVFKSWTARVAVITFRGTQFGSLKNWATDADILVRRVELGDGENATHVHEGFLKVLDRVLPQVQEWVQSYIIGSNGVYNIPFDWKLVFTGHSLGGALALLAATMAEVHNWRRKPDAVITFGAPRVADGRLSSWWESRGLCEKLLRVVVYNDAVPWTPASGRLSMLSSVASCVQHPQDCLKLLHENLAPGNRSQGATDGDSADRWAHVCPRSEYVVPGALKGINGQLQDFSPLGGALAHFMSNALFGYGYGILYGGILLHDEYCGMTPEAFPKFHCSVVEDLTGVVCMGLSHDKGAPDAETCRARCCDDPFCEVWQMMRDGRCWRGRSQACYVRHPYAHDVVVSERVH